ncbi:hypothetical protein ACFPRL_11705 [Pseudoclavibacter helvolus]
MLRRHGGRAVPVDPREGRADEADLDGRPRRWPPRRHLGAVAVRHPSAVQAHLRADARRLPRRWAHHRNRRRREDERVRVHLPAHDPGLRQHPAVRRRRWRSVLRVDVPRDLLRLPQPGAAGRVRGGTCACRRPGDGEEGRDH